MTPSTIGFRFVTVASGSSYLNSDIHFTYAFRL